ncbi:unnamed protein product [Blepharisma stoltei]|uniref:Uncharacterized protein n=1 Tax=Blepharisma stoltei TaxID=1481888 RepID=A0AAU9IQD1_9CILI|nr:unnamed protein product [Blepharisma stoltei]
MDHEQLKAKLELRENQLREMASHLAEQMHSINVKRSYISEMQTNIQRLEKKLNKKNKQLEQELKDKEIIIARIKGLEEIADISKDAAYYKRSKILTKEEKDDTADYLEYYAKLRDSLEAKESFDDRIKDLVESGVVVKKEELANEKENGRTA